MRDIRNEGAVSGVLKAHQRKHVHKAGVGVCPVDHQGMHLHSHRLAVAGALVHQQFHRLRRQRKVPLEEVEALGILGAEDVAYAKASGHTIEAETAVGVAHGIHGLNPLSQPVHVQGHRQSDGDFRPGSAVAYNALDCRRILGVYGGLG